MTIDAQDIKNIAAALEKGATALERLATFHDTKEDDWNYIGVFYADGATPLPGSSAHTRYFAQCYMNKRTGERKYLATHTSDTYRQLPAATTRAPHNDRALMIHKSDL